MYLQNKNPAQAMGEKKIMQAKKEKIPDLIGVIQ